MEGLIHPRLLSSFRDMRGALALFGGTFDPVHSGHLHVAECAQRGGIDSVVFVPARQNPLKERAPTGDTHRIRMLLAAIADRPGLYVSTIEIDRSGPSYTVDTLEQVRREIPSGSELSLLVGSDNLPDLHRWRNIDRVFELASVTVVPREDRDRNGWEHFIDSLPLKTSHRESLKRHLMGASVNPASATMVRRDPAGTDFLPGAVREYAMEHGLYGLKPR